MLIYLILFILSFIFSIFVLVSPISVNASLANIDLTNAQSSVGERFAEVFCEAKNGGLNSEDASEYALNNTYLKFVALPDDQEYIDDLWSFTSKTIIDNCGLIVDTKELQDLEIFFKEESIIASNRDLYLPSFENS
tara:strand:- start:161 stop:568 length:408 start_codon:yes stop_codon:yes gene_type:complete